MEAYIDITSLLAVGTGYLIAMSILGSEKRREGSADGWKTPYPGSYTRFTPPLTLTASVRCEYSEIKWVEKTSIRESGLLPKSEHFFFPLSFLPVQ